jgi:3-phenylpropionate/trans-cinnamate dioxygenase ferredoxin component
VASVDELPVETMKRVLVPASGEAGILLPASGEVARSAGGEAGIPICLAHAEDGGFYALNDVCTHEEFSLCDGELWGMDVECPQHGSRFNLQTGKVTGLPAVIPAQTYPVSVEGGDVYVDL